jgi:hypothetical protein
MRVRMTSSPVGVALLARRMYVCMWWLSGNDVVILLLTIQLRNSNVRPADLCYLAWDEKRVDELV